MKYVPTLTREGEMPLPDENVFTFDDLRFSLEETNLLQLG